MSQLLSQITWKNELVSHKHVKCLARIYVVNDGALLSSLIRRSQPICRVVFGCKHFRLRQVVEEILLDQIAHVALERFDQDKESTTTHSESEFHSLSLERRERLDQSCEDRRMRVMRSEFGGARNRAGEKYTAHPAKSCRYPMVVCTVCPPSRRVTPSLTKPRRATGYGASPVLPSAEAPGRVGHRTVRRSGLGRDGDDAAEERGDRGGRGERDLPPSRCGGGRTERATLHARTIHVGDGRPLGRGTRVHRRSIREGRRSPSPWTGRRTARSRPSAPT